MRVKGLRRRRTPSDRFIKVVWHIRSPRLLPRPRVGTGTPDTLFYLLFHFKAASRLFSLAPHRRGIKVDGHKVRKRLVLRHLGIPADTRSADESERERKRERQPYGAAPTSSESVHARGLIKPTSTYRKTQVYKVSIVVCARRRCVRMQARSTVNNL